MDRLGRVVFVAGSRCVWRPCSRAVRSVYRSISTFNAIPTPILHRYSASLSPWAITGQSTLEQRCLHVSSLYRATDKQKAQESVTDSQPLEQLSLGDRIVKSIGWMGGFYSRKSVLSRSALEIYKSCIDQLDYEAFFKACSLPDTMQSWFLVAQLHIWMCLVRLKREGKDGAYVTREVVSTFWFDVKERTRALGVHSSSLVYKSLREMTAEFYGLTIAYEEGLLLDDRVLAAAVWRNLIHDKDHTDPVQMEAVVKYIRSQVLHMDQIDSEVLLKKGKISLLPFTPPQ